MFASKVKLFLNYLFTVKIHASFDTLIMAIFEIVSDSCNKIRFQRCSAVERKSGFTN